MICGQGIAERLSALVLGLRFCLWLLSVAGPGQHLTSLHVCVNAFPLTSGPACFRVTKAAPGFWEGAGCRGFLPSPACDPWRTGHSLRNRKTPSTSQQRM